MTRMMSPLVLLLVLVCLISAMFPNRSVAVAASVGGSSATSTSGSSEYVPPTHSDDAPYRTDSTLTLSSVPKLGETVDLTFTIKVVRSDSSC